MRKKKHRTQTRMHYYVVAKVSAGDLMVISDAMRVKTRFSWKLCFESPASETVQCNKARVVVTVARTAHYRYRWRRGRGQRLLVHVINNPKNDGLREAICHHSNGVTRIACSLYYRCQVPTSSRHICSFIAIAIVRWEFAYYLYVCPCIGNPHRR